MPESWTELWRNASPLKRALIAGVPAIVAVFAVVGGVFAFSGGGSADSGDQLVRAATDVPATATPVPPTATAIPPTPAPTETPASAGVQASSDTTGGASTDSGDTGGGADYVPYTPPRYLSGPGPEESTAMTLVIPSIGVNASVTSRSVGENGQMGNPGGPWQAVWYDFSIFGGLGGYPGQPGANAVFAGHVDYIGVGPAVFWSIRDLQPGDIVTVYTETGPINYSIQWSQWAQPDEDFSGFVSQGGQESITLVTCIGGFSAGHYSNRLIVRGVRV
jgi:LPXTG-site transpeptidase (sortase) family protein